MTRLDDFLVGAHVDPAIWALCPGYRVLLVAVDGVRQGATDEVSETLLQRAEAHARSVLASTPVDQVPTVAAWREAYRAFGAKPQRTRNSLEALMRRAETGLPRINRPTDIYNAISVLHGIPLGGEDLDRYSGSPRLLRATGAEPFETVAAGEDVIEHPEPGEVVWADAAGVTCRRWNWRQGRRTALREDTNAALFILDALAPVDDAELARAGDGLVEHVGGPGAVAVRRLITSADG